MIELDGIRAPTAESITGVEWSHNVEFVDIVTHQWIVLFQFSPLTFPHLFDFVATTFKVSYFWLRTNVHIFHATVFETTVTFTSVWVAFATPMKKASLKFVDSICVFAVPVHRVIRVGNSEFPQVSRMLNLV